MKLGTNRVRELNMAVEYHRALYYHDDAPVICDHEFDLLWELLLKQKRPSGVKDINWQPELTAQANTYVFSGRAQFAAFHIDLRYDDYLNRRE